ncbi:hypothetical protein [Ornithinimicrobium kibberense]|uniref:hypothetical protein n=1 Tax=Ornithinimicrobium kibberense TaxID=282060 RepID=UPI00360BCC26
MSPTPRTPPALGRGRPCVRRAGQSQCGGRWSTIQASRPPSCGAVATSAVPADDGRSSAGSVPAAVAGASTRRCRRGRGRSAGGRGPVTSRPVPRRPRPRRGASADRPRGGPPGPGRPRGRGR